MARTLADYLELLTDEYLAQKVDLVHDQVREGYRLQRLRVADFGEFRDEIGAYYQHHMAAVTGGSLVYDPDWAKGDAYARLERTFRGGAEEAYKCALLGTQGGLRGVINHLAERLKLEQGERWRAQVLASLMDPLDGREADRLATEVLQRIQADLPPGAQHITHSLVVARLRDHVRMLAESLSRVRRGLQRR